MGMMSQLAHVICAFCRVTCLVLDPGPTHRSGGCGPNTSVLDFLCECSASQNFNVVAWHHGPRCSGRPSVQP